MKIKSIYTPSEEQILVIKRKIIFATIWQSIISQGHPINAQLVNELLLPYAYIGKGAFDVVKELAELKIKETLSIKKLALSLNEVLRGILVIQKKFLEVTEIEEIPMEFRLSHLYLSLFEKNSLMKVLDSNEGTLLFRLETYVFAEVHMTRLKEIYGQKVSQEMKEWREILEQHKLEDEEDGPNDVYEKDDNEPVVYRCYSIMDDYLNPPFIYLGENELNISDEIDEEKEDKEDYDDEDKGEENEKN